MELLKPSLYEPAAVPAEAGALARLRGGKCMACESVFFPFQAYGCEVCGAHGAQLERHELSGRASLLSCATVHIHDSGGKLNVSSPMATPFVVATVRLEEGPITRALVVGGNDASLRVGDRLQAVLVPAPLGEEGLSAWDVRFVPEGASWTGVSPRTDRPDAADGDGPEWHSF